MTSAVLTYVDRAVETVQDKAIIPVVTAARAAVFGIIVATMSVIALTLFAIALVRILDVYLPYEVWAAYAAAGGLFVIIGLLLWRKRKPKESNA